MWKKKIFWWLKINLAGHSLRCQTGQFQILTKPTHYAERSEVWLGRFTSKLYQKFIFEISKNTLPIAPKTWEVINLGIKKICILFSDNPTTHAFFIIFWTHIAWKFNFLDLNQIFGILVDFKGKLNVSQLISSLISYKIKMHINI